MLIDLPNFVGRKDRTKHYIVLQTHNRLLIFHLLTTKLLNYNEENFTLFRGHYMRTFRLG